MTTPSIEQVWIGNRRAKQNRIQNGNSKMYPKCRKYSRGPTAYSLFASGQPKGDMDGGDYLKKLGEQWKSLDPASVKKFQTESKELRCTLLKGRSRSEVISQEIKAIQNSIMTLAEVGFAIGGFGTDPEDILNSKNDICFVTSKAS
ncbi:hypothetical protein LOTGIDRAFT_155054 [Lottia gigantea]|uniref:HMG box domain-containing protein n=1 Tax=Lottia gigantea TaxID=225164 RepID=V4B9H1_LOTGI|nr:hypothetical protein LOTGIDRAFT_155054 [Lottia gigantea]ESO85564.1 hypothetical protein LOTGIDRAFT_155054 [Lottia gigantea]